jgi:O-acetylhomoserine (thiol)-lyase
MTHDSYPDELIRKVLRESKTIALDRPRFRDTLAIHAGRQAGPNDGRAASHATPIYQTTSFVFDDVDHAASLFGLQAFGNIYTRITNPTNAVLEERVAALEGGTAALAVASGHAAEFLVFHTLLQPGDEVDRLQQALWRLDQPVQPQLEELRLGREVGRSGRSGRLRGGRDAEDQGDLHRVDRQSGRRHHRHRRRSPRSPRSARVPLIVDNTLATPYLVKPFEHGADIIVHSATKFLGGHGNSIAGVIVDGGTFDWLADKRYPMLSEPRPEYNGMVLGETFGNFAFAIACRVLGLRDLGPASRRSTPS